MPIKLSPREKKLVVIALGFVAFFVFYQVLLAPKLDQIGRLRVQVQKARLELKIAEGKINILDALEKEVGGRLPEESPALREKRALGILMSLSRTVLKSGLNLVSIEPIIAEGQEKKFRLFCFGNYNQLYGFLMILQDLPGVVIIDSLEISGEGDQEPVLNINMSLTAYD
ncbi:MAG: type II secretion system protein M [Candidatus Margulisbacteria bacterium]|nr:type II secretion system protein M [Candidatus Margulisiibacteriota bacterium]